MLVENQIFEIKWNNFTKKWYESKGYTFTKINDTFTVNLEDLHPGSIIKICVICDYCGSQKEISYRDYNKQIENEKKYACKNCSGKKNIEYNHDKKRYFQLFLEKCDYYNCVPVSKIEDYKNSYTKLKFICPDHGLQQITRASIVSGCWCVKCGKRHAAEKMKKSFTEVKDIVESKNNNVLLNPENYINVNTNNLQVICGSCGETFTTSLSSIMNSDGACRNCGIKKSSGLNKLTPQEVENRINSVNNNVLLNPEEYIDNSTLNLNIKCGDCGRTYVTSLSNYEYNQKIRCDCCSQRISVPERKVMSLLDLYKIDYEYNFKFDDCRRIRPLPFDFYLPQNNLIIETDGEHHFRPIWGENHFIQTKQNDFTKNEYCKLHKIDILRIPYWDFDNIDEILIEKLNLSTFITPRIQRKKMIYRQNKINIQKIA